MTSEEMITIGEIYLNPDHSSGKMVILKETAEADRYFLMFVGDAEFAAIAKEKGLLQSKRPLTHDLYLSIMEKIQLEFLRIEITDMRENTYYASVIFRFNDAEHAIDSRPSDAVALALNRKIPIMVNEKLFRPELTEEQVKEYEQIVKTVKF
jgi:bifunctional DNase/RNase